MPKSLGFEHIYPNSNRGPQSCVSEFRWCVHPFGYCNLFFLRIFLIYASISKEI